MARIRTIKPEFWTHEDLSLLPEATHMLAAALLNHSDDEGYFNANPGLVKAACCPLREPSVSIQDSLKSLEKTGFIRTCTGSDGKRYGHVITFDDHQRVNRPTPSKIKPLCSFTETSVNPHGESGDDSPPERKGKEQGKEGKGEDACAPPPPPKKPKGKKVTLAEYIDQQTLAKERLIPEDHAVLKYAQQVGIPENFLHLAWQKFKTRYTSGDSAQKKYIDWPAVFDNAVRDNWMKVWFIESGIYKLTTVGQQAELARKSHVAH